jgi:serpin B
MRLTCTSLLLTLFLCFIACDGKLSVIGLPETERDLSSNEKTLVATDNAFGIRLFNEICTTQADSNVFISPLSVSMALSMTTNGAAGATETAMRTALGSEEMTMDEINASSRSLIDLLENLDPDVIFEIANSIWPREGFEVETDFLEVNRRYFDAEIRELDFNLPSAPDTINGWIADATHGKIDRVINWISRETMMFVINAIYFLGLWETPFDPDQTTEGTFKSPAGNLPCRMMHIESAFDYFETDTLQAVDLPYGNGRYSMTVILPKSGFSADDLAASLRLEDLNRWTTSLSEEELVLNLPAFTMEYEVELKDVLTTLGMGIAFDPSSADFSGIHPAGGLFISSVLHKTYIEVDEEGTEAAAVTVVVVGRTSIGGRVMTVDRPFLFIIRERHSGSILFIGKMVTP